LSPLRGAREKWSGVAIIGTATPSSALRKRAMHRSGGALAVLDGLHGEVELGADAVAAGPDAFDRRRVVLIHRDAAAAEREHRGGAVPVRVRAAVQDLGDQHLADGLHDLVGGEREVFAGALRLAAGA